jgi:hypothetical protein
MTSGMTRKTLSMDYQYVELQNVHGSKINYREMEEKVVNYRRDLATERIRSPHM